MKKKTVYGVFVGSGGLSGVVKLKGTDTGDGGPVWYESDDGHYSAHGTIGLHVNNDRTHFTYLSTNKNSAEIFLLGARACHHVMFKIGKTGKFSKEEIKEFLTLQEDAEN